MKLPLPDNVIDVIRRDGIKKLNPPQLASVKPLFSGKSLVVSAPTASGKTLIAEFAILKAFLSNKKILYLVPLKALANEKYIEFRKKYEILGMKIAVSTGDIDSSSDYLGRYDLVIVSNEKADSLLRHEAKWLRDVHLVITDEIHILNDVSRGPALEIVLTRMRDYAKQIIALSATIQNADELAEWLGASLIKSDYRPIKLHKGVCYPAAEGSIIDLIKKKKKIKGEGEVSLCKDCVSKGKQSIVFVSTRRSAEATAERIGKKIEFSLTKDEKKHLAALGKEIKNSVSQTTRQCHRLANTIEKGVAFHHAGLVAKQRKLIEDAFKSGLIKIVTATPTLALGVNLPAYRVVIRDTRRYGGYGSSFIPVMEVRQMFGRAGRPKYDKEGEAIILAKSEIEAEEAKDRYIFSELEPLYSKLSIESVLRMHTLALISSGIESRGALKKFFDNTFFAHQYGDAEEVMDIVEKILKQLTEWDFIQAKESNFISNEFVPAFNLGKDAEIKATRLGKRVAQLYIDPMSAHQLITNLSVKSDIENLIIICQCSEMRPLLRPRKGDSVEEKIPYGVEVPNVWDIEYEKFIAAAKTALMLIDWCSEWGEDKLLEKYGVTPGELYNKKSYAEWLLFSAREFALLKKRKDLANDFSRLQMQVKHGVRKELLPLVSVKGIGRVRARILYKNGIRSLRDIKSKKKKVETLLGKKIAENIINDAK